MKSTVRSIAIVAAAALSLPALAAEQSTATVDPTWPSYAARMPALQVDGPAAQEADTTQPEFKGSAPAIALTPYASDAETLTLAGGAPSIHVRIDSRSARVHVAAK